MFTHVQAHLRRGEEYAKKCKSKSEIGTKCFHLATLSSSCAVESVLKFKLSSSCAALSVVDVVVVVCVSCVGMTGLCRYVRVREMPSSVHCVFRCIAKMPWIKNYIA